MIDKNTIENALTSLISYLSSDDSESITAVSIVDSAFKVAGDFTEYFHDTGLFYISGSTGNDGRFTCDGDSSYDSGTDATTITVSETIEDDTVDGSIVSPFEIVIENQAQPTSEKPYASLAIVSTPNIGREFEGDLSDAGVVDIIGQREINIRIQFYGTSALKKADNLITSLHKRTITDILESDGLGYLRNEPVTRIPALMETDYEERASVNVIFSYISEDTDNLGLIETIKATETYIDPSGRKVVDGKEIVITEP